ncbi:MAG: fibronectin type III domain-containing protein, partial [Chloroflexota bacterium]
QTPPSPVIQGRLNIVENQTRLFWASPEVTNVDGYHIYRQGYSEEAQLIAEVPPTITEYIDLSTCGYIYSITAFNDAGESLASQTSYATPDCSP